MTETAPKIIAHATDLKPDGGIAFEHSVALATRAGAKLFTLHANPESLETARELPDAEVLLHRWSWQGPQLDFVRMSHSCCEDPVDTLLDALKNIHPDLLVIGSHQTHGLAKLVHQSMSVGVALNAKVPVLVLPIGHRGFVDPASGNIRLRSIVMPVGSARAFEFGFSQLDRWLSALSVERVAAHLVCVGDPGVLEGITLPEAPGLEFFKHRGDGKFAETVCGLADRVSADLLVMATDGQDSFWDFVTGTHTEQVLAKTHCPLLTVRMP